MPNLEDDFLEELQDEIRQLTDKYDYNPRGSDWVCCFCNERPLRNGQSIQHREDCFGARALEKLAAVRGVNEFGLPGPEEEIDD